MTVYRVFLSPSLCTRQLSHAFRWVICLFKNIQIIHRHTLSNSSKIGNTFCCCFTRRGINWIESKQVKAAAAAACRQRVSYSYLYLSLVIYSSKLSRLVSKEGEGLAEGDAAMWAILNVNLALLFYLLFVVGFHGMEFNFSRRNEKAAAAGTGWGEGATTEVAREGRGRGRGRGSIFYRFLINFVWHATTWNTFRLLMWQLTAEGGKG